MQYTITVLLMLSIQCHVAMLMYCSRRPLKYTFSASVWYILFSYWGCGKPFHIAIEGRIESILLVLVCGRLGDIAV